jgi:integrase
MSGARILHPAWIFSTAMATFSRYKKKDGSISYTAQIRIKRGGMVVHSESFTSPKLSTAKAWAKKRESELAEPGTIERIAMTVTVGEVLKWYAAFSENAGRTKSDAIAALQNRDIADLDAIKLTVDDCLDHARSRKPAKPSTIYQDFIWLRLAMKSYRLAKDAPVATQKVDDAIMLLKASKAIAEPDKRDRRPTLPEIDALLKFFDNQDGRARLPMSEIVLFAIFSARRQGEICRIRQADRDGDRILVRAMKHPRQVRDTWVFLTDEAMAILDRQPEGELYFPYDSRSVSAAFHRGCKMCGITGLRFHDLRREGASRLFELGWDIPRVAGVTGHQSWGSLQRYVHLRDRGVTDKYANWPRLPLLHAGGEPPNE